MTKNYGLIVDPIFPEDFFGGSTQSLETKYGDEVINPDADWSSDTPSTEDQDTSDGDSYACCSFGTSNAVEMLARRRFSEPINLSDRFLARISGTKVGQGNSPKTVADTLRKKWSVNEAEWPDVDMVEEYYAEIPEDLKGIALARGAEFEFGYQYITNSPTVIKEALKRSPVCIAVTAWLEQNGVYVRVPGIAENHWTTIVKVLDNGNYKVFDSFYPFDKEVSPDACKSVAMSYYLNRQIVVESAWKKFLRDLVQNALAWFTPPSGTPSLPPNNAVEAPPTPIPSPKPPLAPPTPPASNYDWSNPMAVRHSIRVMCDEEGVDYRRNTLIDGKYVSAKDILTACIQQESGFNPKAIGKPNTNGTRDWGLCQYNDGKNAQGVPYWIGKGAAFASTDEVLNDPEKNVRVMIGMMKAGKINLWSSYSTGAFHPWL